MGGCLGGAWTDRLAKVGGHPEPKTKMKPCQTETAFSKLMNGTGIRRPAIEYGPLHTAQMETNCESFLKEFEHSIDSWLTYPPSYLLHLPDVKPSRPCHFSSF